MGFKRRFEFGLAWRTLALILAIWLFVHSLSIPDLRAARIVAAFVAFAALASLWQFIRKLNRDGHTIVLTTHYLEEAETLCGRIAMLKSGKVVALDTTENLLRRFATHSLRVRLAHPARGAELGGLAGDGGWVEFAFDTYADVEPLLARLREAGAGLTEMQLGEPDLERVFVEVMHRA